MGFGNNTTQNSGQYDKHIYMTNSGQLIFGVNPGSLKTITTSGKWNDGKWHHIVATEGSTGIRLYVDGTLRASDTSVTSSENYSGYWRIAQDNLKGWPSLPTSQFFNGQIDETAVYPTALSAAQIANHYALGTAK